MQPDTFLSFGKMIKVALAKSGENDVSGIRL